MYSRKRLCWIGSLCIVLACSAARAADMGTAQDGGVAAIGPRLITYQGLVENAGGPIDNQSMVVQFRAFNALTGGTQRGLTVTQTLSASAVRKGVFSVEIDADELALPDNADETFLEVAVCSPAPCTAVALAPRQRVTHAPLAVSARNLGGAARAEADGSLVVESSAAASGEMSLRSPGATEAMSLRASDRTLSASPASGAASLKMQALSPDGDMTEAFLNDGTGEMTLSKVDVAATAAISTKSLRFNMATGEVAAARDSGAAPLKLSSKSPTGETNMVLDDGFGQVSISRVEAAANTAGISPPPKFVLDPRLGTIAASVDAGTATMTLLSTSASGDKTQLSLDDALGKVTISKEVVALNTAVASSKKLVIDAANGSVAAFDGIAAASVRFKTGNTTAMEIDPATNGVTALGAGGFKAKRILIDSGIASNTAGVGPSAELSVNGTTGNVELKVGVEIVDRWTPVGDTGDGFAPNRISGSSSNQVAPGVFGAVIAGGGNVWLPNRVTDGYGTVGGGGNNRAGDNAGTYSDAPYATVGGGEGNNAGGKGSTISGGFSNNTLNWGSTVGGGDTNTASGLRSTVGGGYSNTAIDAYTTVGGGNDNTASWSYSTVGGGQSNAANGSWSTVGGGFGNTASGASSTVGGGGGNTAGGESSTVGGGGTNAASGLRATIGGGLANTASGQLSTVPGGYSNEAGGDYSFAAGRRAHVRSTALGDAATDNGTFVWADSTNADFNSSGVNQFLIRASGGTSIYSNSGLTAGVALAAGGGSWSSVSDKNLKENFAEIDKEALLEKLSAIPVTTWNYKSQDSSIRHIGPMGQDFHSAFGVGETDTRLSTIDADGVALAAIQGLYEIVKDKDCRIDELAGDKAVLEARVAALEAMMAKVLAAQQNGGGR